MLVLIFILITDYMLLAVASNFSPVRISISQFELKRLLKKGDKTAQAIVHREKLLDDVVSLQATVTAILLVGLTLVSLLLAGWYGGGMVALLLASSYGSVGRFPVVRKWAQRLYDAHEKRSIHFIEKYPQLISLIRHPRSHAQTALGVGSRQELIYLIEQDKGIFSSDEIYLLKQALRFYNVKVVDIMTRIAAATKIDKKELLGPLVLHDLHRTGQLDFPVTDESTGEIIGMINLSNMLQLTDKQSPTAEAAMDSRVLYIHGQQDLTDALNIFTNLHCNILVVVNAKQETVGIVTLRNVLSVLLPLQADVDGDSYQNKERVAKRAGK